MGVFAVLISIASFGTDRLSLGIAAAVVAAIGFVVGFAWVAIQRKRVLRLERRWLDAHPDTTDGQPPS
ncbi:hypothetical protein DQP55_24360 [Mycolicibacterium sp. GF69]|nr:hypothetical protein DQP55_24360 [Mycolicibacterium sp. GF69]